MGKLTHKMLTSEAEISAYLHRTRMAILEVLQLGPATASQIGEKLGVHSANLTRHIRTLVDVGLVELVEKRDTGRNLEKYYAATAASFDVAPDAKDLESPHKIALAYARSDLSAALSHLADDEEDAVAVFLTSACLRPGDVERLKVAMEQLIESFSAADDKDGAPYHLNLNLYPSRVDSSLAQRIVLRRTTE